MPAQVTRIRFETREPQRPHAHQEAPLEVGLLIARQVEALPLNQVAVDRFPSVIDLGPYAHDRARTGGKYRFRLQKGQIGETSDKNWPSRAWWCAGRCASLGLKGRAVRDGSSRSSNAGRNAAATGSRSSGRFR